MSTARLWRTLRANWWILLIGAVGGGLLATAAVLVMPRTYASHADVLIQAESPDAGGGTDLQLYISNRLPTWIAMAASDENVAEVAQAAGVSTETVTEDLSYSVPPATAVITVTATGTTPAEAQSLARAGADAITGRIAATSSTGVTLDPQIMVAALPGSLAAPDPTIIVPGGIVAGFLAAFLLSLVLGTRNRRPRVLEDIADAIDAPVLAVLDPQRTRLVARAEAIGEPTTPAGLLGRLESSHHNRFLAVPLGGADVRALLAQLATTGAAAGEVPELLPSVEDGPAAELTDLAPTGAVVLLVGPLATTDRIARSARRARVHGAEVEGAVVVTGGRRGGAEQASVEASATTAAPAAPFIAAPALEAGPRDVEAPGVSQDPGVPAEPPAPVPEPAASGTPDPSEPWTESADPDEVETVDVGARAIGSAAATDAAKATEAAEPAGAPGLATPDDGSGNSARQDDEADAVESPVPDPGAGAGAGAVAPSAEGATSTSSTEQTPAARLAPATGAGAVAAVTAAHARSAHTHRAAMDSADGAGSAAAAVSPRISARRARRAAAEFAPARVFPPAASAGLFPVAGGVAITSPSEDSDEDGTRTPVDPASGEGASTDQAPHGPEVAVDATDVADEAPVHDVAPSSDEDLVTDGAPTDDEAPASDDEPVTDGGPVTDEAPTAEGDPVTDGARTADAEPVTDGAPTAAGPPLAPTGDGETAAVAAEPFAHDRSAEPAETAKVADPAEPREDTEAAPRDQVDEGPLAGTDAEPDLVSGADPVPAAPTTDPGTDEDATTDPVEADSSSPEAESVRAPATTSTPGWTSMCAPPAPSAPRSSRQDAITAEIPRVQGTASGEDSSPDPSESAADDPADPQLYPWEYTPNPWAPRAEGDERPEGRERAAPRHTARSGREAG